MASTKSAFRRLKWQRRRTRKRIRKVRRARRRSKTPITIYQIRSQPLSWDFIFSISSNLGWRIVQVGLRSDSGKSRIEFSVPNPSPVLEKSTLKKLVVFRHLQ